jgi:putative CocE/NonD family hydrolase
MRLFRTTPSLLLSFGLCLAAGVSGLLPASAQPTAPTYDFKANYTRSSFYIPMRDGVRLYTTVYAPKDTSQKWPFIMTRTPYSVGPYPPGEFSTPRGIMVKMLQEGYILVNQDVRGRYYSEGTFEDVRPVVPKASGGKVATDESTDTYDTIDWLVKCIPNNNGRVGIWGISYPGYYAAAGGVNSHPALKAISPQAPVSDWFLGDDDHHNGALFLLDYVGFFNGFGRERKDKAEVGNNYLPGTPLEMNNDAYKFYLDLGPLKNVDAKYYHGQIKHWTDVTEHPNYDEFWKERALPAHLKGVKCAVMTVGGWYDAEDKFGPFADFAAINKLDPEAPNSLVVGPWTHGGWAGGDFANFGTEQFGLKTGAYYRDNLFKPFFDYYLKDKGDWAKAKVTVFTTGINQFWRFDEWPPKDVTPVDVALGANHTLSMSAPSSSAAKEFDSYTSDPANPVPYISEKQGRRRNEYLNDDQRFAAARPDVLTYQSEPLTEDMSIAGVIRADLQISTTASDADFIVKVIDVHPDGAPDAGFQRLVRAEVMRARFRDSYSNPKPIIPGKIMQVAYDLRDVSHTFLKGHRIMVQVQSSWFPLVDRNPQTFVPNIYKADEKDFKSAVIQIYHTSKIILPKLNHLPAALPVDSSYVTEAK